MITAAVRPGPMKVVPEFSGTSLVLVGTFHHLVLTVRAEGDIRARMRPAVAGLIACCAEAGPAPPRARADSR